MSHPAGSIVLCVLLLSACRKEDPAPPATVTDSLANNGWTRMTHAGSDTQLGWGPTSLWCVQNESDGGLTPATWYEATFMNTANMGSTWTTTATISGSLGSEEFHLFGPPVFLDDQIGYVTLTFGTLLSSTSVVYKTVNGGVTWAAGGGDGGSFARVGSTARVFRYGASQTYVSQNMGATWSVVVPSIGAINDMVFIDELHGFATGDAGILSSIDGGDSWQNVSGEEFTWISHQDPSVGVAASRFGAAAIRRTSNGWAASESVPTPAEIGAPGSIYLDVTGRLYASKDERLYVSMDLGTEWALDLEMPADNNITWVRRVGEYLVVSSNFKSWARKLVPV